MSTGSDQILYRARGTAYRMSNHVNVSDSVCSQCGACAAVCPKDAITLPRTAAGDYYPEIDEDKCAASCTLCNYVCGGNGIDWEDLHEWRFGEPYAGAPLGHHQGAFSAYAADPDIRGNSASGGSVTALLCHALETGAIQAAAVSGLKNGIEPYTKLATTPEEIRDAAGSIYFSNPALVVLDEIRKFPGKVAFVGLPCHIASLNKAIQRRVIKPDKIAFTVALICGRTANYDLMRGFLRRMGVNPDSVTRLKMRGDGWPGAFRIETASGQTHRFPFPGPEYMSMWKFYQYTPIYCLMCSDPLGNLADITAGDAWLPEFGEDSHGRSVLLVRTGAAMDLLQDAQRQGAVHLDPLEPKRIIEAQRQQVFGKLTNQRNMRRLFRWTQPFTRWPMPNDAGDEHWERGTLFGMGYAIFQFVNCTFSLHPRLRWMLRLLPLVTLARVMGRKRAHAQAARKKTAASDAPRA